MKVYIKSFPRKIYEYGGILSLHQIARALSSKYDTYMFGGWDEDYCKKHGIQIIQDPHIAEDDVVIHPELIVESLAGYPCKNKIGLILAPLGCWHGNPSDYARLEKAGIKFMSNGEAMAETIKKDGGKTAIGVDFPLNEVFNVDKEKAAGSERDIDVAYMPRRGEDVINSVLGQIITIAGAGKVSAVKIHGYEPEVVASIFLRSKVYLASSAYEGIQRPPREAMRCGCVPVGYNSAGHASYMKDGENSFVISVGDYGSHAQKIFELLNDNDKLKMFRENAIKTVEHYTDFDLFTKNMISKFDLLIGG